MKQSYGMKILILILGNIWDEIIAFDLSLVQATYYTIVKIVHYELFVLNFTIVFKAIESVKPPFFQTNK